MERGKLQSLVELAYPPVCVGCDAPVASDYGLCPACLPDVPFIAGDVCPTCGDPQPSVVASVPGPCDACLATPRNWCRGVAVMEYDRMARTLVMRFKHGDRPDLARPLGKWLARAVQPLVSQKTLIVPVPLHRWRLFRRMFNQSALLAKEVAAQTGARILVDGLIRVRATPSQGQRSHSDRFTNTENAMQVADSSRADIAGNPVLLIDDVMASGATLQDAARACLEAGAARVDVGVLARVSRDPFVRAGVSHE